MNLEVQCRIHKVSSIILIRINPIPRIDTDPSNIQENVKTFIVFVAKSKLYSRGIKQNIHVIT